MSQELLSTPVAVPPLDQGKFTDIEEWMKENDKEDVNANTTKEIKARSASKAQADGTSMLGTSVVGSNASNEAVQFFVDLERDLDLGGVNWIGRLLEYRAAHPSEAATSFTDSTVGNRFTCTAVIGESVEHFGSTTIGFIKKKDAKQYAAKKAVEWLIENRYMPADGSVSFPKQVPTSPTLSNSTSLKNTFAQQVPILCVKLGFSPPTYVLEPREGATAMYNGYAHFAGDPRVYGRVGEFHNVFGKKNAKEVCAEGVLAFLRGVERDRMGLATANTNSTSDAGGEKVLEFLDAVESQTEDSEVEENGKRKRLGDKSVIADTAAASTEKKTKLTSDL